MIKNYKNLAGKVSVAIQYKADGSNYEEIIEVLAANGQKAKHYAKKQYINIEVRPNFESYYILKPSEWLVKNYTKDYAIVADKQFKISFKEIK